MSAKAKTPKKASAAPGAKGAQSLPLIQAHSRISLCTYGSPDAWELGAEVWHTLLRRRMQDHHSVAFHLWMPSNCS